MCFAGHGKRAARRRTWHRCASPDLAHLFYGLYTRPAQHTARENSVAENVAKARLRIITCPFRIYSTLPRNRFCGPRRVYVDQFGPSSFLSCAGLL